MNVKEYIEEYKTFIILMSVILIIMFFGKDFNMFSVVLTGFWGLIILSVFWYFQTIKLMLKGELK